MPRGKVKILCDTVTCIWHETDNKDNTYCGFKPCLKNQKCINFKPNTIYYVIQFLNAMEDSNMLPSYSLTEEVRIGAYYAMKIFNLGMVECTHGDWKWINFFCNDGPEDKYLYGDEILELPANSEVIADLTNKLLQGLLPPFEDEKISMEQERKKEEEKLKPFEVEEDKLKWYGFVDKLGNWYPADFGEHEGLAFEILDKNGWEDEYYNQENRSTAVDFLVNVKGWVLLHNPYGTGTTQVQISPTHTLTKAQKEFLYVYFMEHKQILKAEQYLEVE